MSEGTLHGVAFRERRRLVAAPAAVGGALRALAWVACFGLAAYLRASGLRAALVGDELAASGPDAAFHARRMLQAWADFPHVPIRDRLLDWPHGGIAPWPPGYDFGAALLAQLARDRASALLIIGAYPVLLGLLLVAATAWTIRLLLPDAPWWTRWNAAFIVAVAPQAVAVARFGNTDHHIAESLAMLALGAWSLYATRAVLGALSWRARITLEGLAAAVGFSALAVFVGAAAYLMIAACGLMLVQATARRAPALSWAAGAPGLLLASLLVAALYSPLVAAHGRSLDYAFPSWLQPMLMAAAAVGCAAGSLFSRLREASSRQRRVAAGATLLALALAVVLLGRSAALTALEHGFAEWFGGGSGALLAGGTTESLPLFSGWRFWELAFWERCHRYYGVFGLLAPLAYLLAARACLERNGLRASLPWLVWTISITGLALYQNRFGRLALVNLAICSALALAYVASRWPALRRIAPLLPLLAFALDPIFHHYLAWQPSQALPPEQESAAFLRTHTSAPRPGQHGAVLTPWDQSHYVVRYGERPVTATGFGFYLGGGTYDEVEALWRSDEAALLRFMERRDVGYVVAGQAIFDGLRLHGQGPWLDTGLNLAFFQKLPVSVLMLGGSGSARLALPHLTRLMPRHASVWRTAPAVPYPASWVYERVAGARVRGHAPAGSIVRLQLPMRVRDVTLRHEAWSRADARGEFEIVTPLPTHYSADGIETADQAELQISGRAAESVSVSEAAVMAGLTLSAGG